MAVDIPKFPNEQQISLNPNVTPTVALTSSGCSNPINAVDDDPTTAAVFPVSPLSIAIPGLPTGALTLDLQRSTNNSTWSTLQSSVPPNSTYLDASRTNPPYWYRILANNANGSTPGTSISG